jgi:hypothetical protein
MTQESDNQDTPSNDFDEARNVFTGLCNGALLSFIAVYVVFLVITWVS